MKNQIFMRRLNPFENTAMYTIRFGTQGQHNVYTVKMWRGSVQKRVGTLSLHAPYDRVCQSLLE